MRVLDRICPTQKKNKAKPTMAYGEQGLMGVRISLATLPVGSPLVHTLGRSIKVLHSAPFLCGFVCRARASRPACVSCLRSLGRRAWRLAPGLFPMPTGGSTVMGGLWQCLVTLSSTFVPAHAFSGASTKSPSQVEKVAA